MGIQGLLPNLKSIMTPVHVRHYAGKKAAIDTYSWLHKAAYTCSKDLCQGRSTDKFIHYCMHRVNLLRHYGVLPVLVFDGGVLPMKAEQEAKRARSRKEHLERALEHERLGNHSAANECYQRAVDITPALAYKLIKVLQQEGVEYVVAPYEADAQMAYLALNDHVQVVITEDSDLIAYGCPQVFFKMNKTGEGDAFQFSDLVRNKDLNFTNFTKQMVLEMCVMTGCDYLPSLPGMGVKKAHGLIRRFKSYQKVIKHLRFSGVSISAQYEELFVRALLTFRHQRVYDPISQEMVHLTDVSNDMLPDLEFVGPDLPQKLVKAIAEGEVDPSTNLPFQDQAVTTVVPISDYKGLSHWNSGKKPQGLLEQKNVLTNYFFSPSHKRQTPFRTPRCAHRNADVPAEDAGHTVVPETEHLVNLLDVCPKATEVFGTPLPDDDEDSDSGAVQEDQDIALIDSELQDAKSRRTGFLQVSQQHSSAAAGRFSSKEREKHSVDGSQVKLSGYFSHKQLAHCEKVNSSILELEFRNGEREYKSSDSCITEARKKSKVDPSERICDEFKEESSPLKSLHRVPLEDMTRGRQKSAIPLLCGRKKSAIPPVCEKRNQLPALRKDDRSELRKFSANISHIGKFARVAQKSIDQFAESIAPFRFSAKGTRASGLRAPMSNVCTNIPARIDTKGHLNLEAVLNKFSWDFKPPRQNLSHSHVKLVTGTVETQQ